jgi:hypothetical protein
VKRLNGKSRRHYQPRHRQFSDGLRLAALRAFTAARLVLRDGMSVHAAAQACGSCTAYVLAALTLIRSENNSLIEKVLYGEITILAAAHEVKRLGVLVAAFRKASAADRVAFARAIGPSVLFDTSLVPAL